MKFWLRENPKGSEKSYTLMRYDEPAGSATPDPGAFDNAHFEFWCEIERLREQVKAAGQMFNAVNTYAMEAGFGKQNQPTSLASAGVRMAEAAGEYDLLRTENPDTAFGQ